MEHAMIAEVIYSPVQSPFFQCHPYRSSLNMFWESFCDRHLGWLQPPTGQIAKEPLDTRDSRCSWIRRVMILGRWKAQVLSNVQQVFMDRFPGSCSRVAVLAMTWVILGHKTRVSFSPRSKINQKPPRTVVESESMYQLTSCGFGILFRPN